MMKSHEGPLNMLRGTRIGDINRKIKDGVSGVIQGIPGATTQALMHAREREEYLAARHQSGQRKSTNK